MYEDYITDEIKGFFDEKDENNKKILQEEELKNIIDSKYKNRMLFITNTILPIFNNFKYYLNSKDINCEIENDDKNGVSFISVYIECKNDKDYGPNKLIFKFDYSNKSSKIFTGMKLEFIDEIEFIEKSGWEAPVGMVNFNDLLNENKPKEKIKIDDINEKIILEKLFNWFNKLVKDHKVK